MVLLDVAMNMSYANATYGIQSMTSWLPILAVVIAASIVLGLVLTAVSFWWFKKVIDFINGFTGTLKYVLYGIGTLCGFTYIWYIAWGVLAWNSKSNIPLWYYPLGAVAYAFLYAVGKVSENVYQRLEKNYGKAKKVKKL